MIRTRIGRLVLTGIAALAIFGCAPETGPEWTFSTPPPSVGASAAPSSPSPSP